MGDIDSLIVTGCTSWAARGLRNRLFYRYLHTSPRAHAVSRTAVRASIDVGRVREQDVRQVKKSMRIPSMNLRTYLESIYGLP